MIMTNVDDDDNCVGSISNKMLMTDDDCVGSISNLMAMLMTYYYDNEDNEAQAQCLYL